MSTEPAPTTPKKRRSDTGPRLIDRDFEALQWIAEQYLISLDHLCLLLARLTEPGEYTQQPKEKGRLTEKRATAVVKRWEQLGLVERKWLLYGEPPLIWLTNDGLKLVAQELGELRSYTPALARLDHLNAINTARLYIEDRRQDAIWKSERLIRASQGRTEAGKKRPHTPDAIVTADNRQIAVEIELSSKAYSRLDKILHEMALDLNYHTVWYFTRDRATKVVAAAMTAMREQYKGKFVLYRMDENEEEGTTIITRVEL